MGLVRSRCSSLVRENEGCSQLEEHELETVAGTDHSTNFSLDSENELSLNILSPDFMLPSYARFLIII